jgi:hypothetical protein
MIPTPHQTPMIMKEVIVDTQKLIGYQQVKVILKDGSLLTIPIGSDKIYVMRPNGGWGVLTLQSGKELKHVDRIQSSSSRRGSYAGP